MSRALLTETERLALQRDDEQLDHQNPSQYRYQTRTRLRERIEQLERDLEILSEHEPELATEIEKAVLPSVLEHLQQDLREHRQMTETSR